MFWSTYVFSFHLIILLKWYISPLCPVSRQVSLDEGTLFTSDALISTWSPGITRRWVSFYFYFPCDLFTPRPSKGFSTVCRVRRCNTRKEKWHVRTDTRNSSINLAPRFFCPFIRVFLSRALLPCLTVRWPFRRSVRSIGCRSSCRCDRRRRQTWFSGICDTWRSAQPRPFCVSPNASVSSPQGSAPHPAFVYKPI